MGSEMRSVTRAQYNAAFGAQDRTPPTPVLDDELQPIWDMWWRLNARRPPSQSIEPLSFSEISAFNLLSLESLSADEVRLLEVLDDAYVHQARIEQREAQKRAEQNAKNQPKR